MRASVSFSFGAVAIVGGALVWIACSSGSSAVDGGGAGTSNPGASSGSGDSGSTSGAGNTVDGGASGNGGNLGADASPTDSASPHGGDGSSEGGGGSARDASGGGEGPSDGGCPGAPCSSGEMCCSEKLVNGSPSCQASCPPDDLVGCTRPADCAGAASGTECCATAVLEANADGAAFPYCTISTFTSHCGTCTTNIGTSCTATEQLHVCTQPSDCASEGNECCAVGNYEICVSSVLASFGNLTCM